MTLLVVSGAYALHSRYRAAIYSAMEEGRTRPQFPALSVRLRVSGSSAARSVPGRSRSELRSDGWIKTLLARQTAQTMRAGMFYRRLIAAAEGVPGAVGLVQYSSSSSFVLSRAT
ncbi:hypothetical protein F2P81_004148 [Scophthalmus maximus]|uniref:Uncharacterized protein n=1 Tax=Scophthalmus maximus TaxID=52904 RepID=A0A6A4TIW4_SCOMX|nr:hypothetical protein F2P81_004148 [Scophthalmus maximus]